eukprot:TRINITY_DN1694_c0_g2_i8.p1 TRINITY_DN1694_c0_g2~~TRINITY_DN1694_c0_g2_i8.p1  ORF type:complete len:214 (-),score=25.68 TRINITY_DN1694_c0_g2_i8:301-858(-)
MCIRDSYRLLQGISRTTSTATPPFANGNSSATDIIAYDSGSPLDSIAISTATNLNLNTTVDIADGIEIYTSNITVISSPDLFDNTSINQSTTGNKTSVNTNPNVNANSTSNNTTNNNGSSNSGTGTNTGSNISDINPNLGGNSSTTVNASTADSNTNSRLPLGTNSQRLQLVNVLALILGVLYMF